MMHFEVYPDPEFVADLKYGSRHNCGCAVDVTLIDWRQATNCQCPPALPIIQLNGGISIIKAGRIKPSWTCLSKS